LQKDTVKMRKHRRR